MVPTLHEISDLTRVAGYVTEKQNLLPLRSPHLQEGKGGHIHVHHKGLCRINRGHTRPHLAPRERVLGTGAFAQHCLQLELS